MAFPLDLKDELEEHLAKSIACPESEKDTAGSQTDKQAKMEGAERKRKGVNENREKKRFTASYQMTILQKEFWPSSHVQSATS